MTVTEEYVKDVQNITDGTAPITVPADVDTSGIPADMDVSVFVAWSRVMAEVQFIGKNGRKTGAGGTYDFRGIDAVLNAVGPALRKHAVTVVQTGADTTYEAIRTSGGSAMRLCVARVQYVVYGPKGDSFPMVSVGEAFDSGDKSTVKAMSVALRTLYINSLAIPTNQPQMDPEYGTQHEIATPAAPTAEEYADEIVRERTSLDRLIRIRRELTAHPDIAETVVTTVTGEEIKLIDLLTRIGRERQAAAAPKA
jgi:hypothetical protein